MKVWVVLAGQAYEGYDIVGIYESEEGAKKQELETLRSSRYDFVKIQEDFVIRSGTTRNELDVESMDEHDFIGRNPFEEYRKAVQVVAGYEASVGTSDGWKTITESKCPKCETKWTALLQSICPYCGYKLVAATQDACDVCDMPLGPNHACLPRHDKESK